MERLAQLLEFLNGRDTRILRQCGTPMHYMSTRWPGEMHLFASTLDDLTLYKPTAHVHWAERAPWLLCDDSLPRYDGRSPE